MFVMDRQTLIIRTLTESENQNIEKKVGEIQVFEGSSLTFGTIYILFDNVFVVI